MKKQLLLFISLLLPLVASAAAVEIDGIYYNLVSKVKQAEVTSKPSGYYSGTITIPESVEYDGVTYSVTSIGKEAFKECTSMTSIIIGNGVEKIGDDAFLFCKNVASISIGDNVATIGKHAFGYCERLSKISLPNSVQSVGTNLFNNCKNLSSVVIGNGLKTMGYGMFEYCSNLQSVTIGENVTSIGQEAFHNCSKLTSITIPKSVSYINKSAFWDCTSLRSVIISDIAAWCKIEFVDFTSNPLYYAHHLYFDDGTEIKDITIPDNTTSIGNYVFSGCSGLTSIEIPNSVTSIGGSAFYGCSGLTSIEIPNSVTSIGRSAFYGCTGLTSIEIPNSVTSIDNKAFYNCDDLTSVTIGNGIQFIGTTAFANCAELTDVYCYAESVPTTGSDAFDGSLIEYVTLHVPSSSVNLYRSTAPWSGFKEVVAISGETPELDKCATPTISFKGGKLHFECETPDVTYHYTITPPSKTDNTGNDVEVGSSYTVQVYASKDCYLNSDTATQDIDIRGIKGDVDGDGVVDVNDVQTTINIILKK